MTITVITSFTHLLDVLSSTELQCGHVVFRGVKDTIEHKLIPTVGRIQLPDSNILALIKYENEVLSSFKNRAYSELSKIPTNDLQWLALAHIMDFQHAF